MTKKQLKELATNNYCCGLMYGWDDPDICKYFLETYEDKLSNLGLTELNIEPGGTDIMGHYHYEEGFKALLCSDLKEGFNFYAGFLFDAISDGVKIEELDVDAEDYDYAISEFNNFLDSIGFVKPENYKEPEMIFISAYCFTSQEEIEAVQASLTTKKKKSNGKSKKEKDK